MSLIVQPWLRQWQNFWLSKPFGLDTTPPGKSLTNTPSTVRKCAVPPDHLRSEISFSRTCKIPKHWKSTKTRRSYLNEMCILFVFSSDNLLILVIHYTLVLCSNSHKFVINLELCLPRLKIFMSTNTNICSVWNFLRGNTASDQNFCFIWNSILKL